MKLSNFVAVAAMGALLPLGISNSRAVSATAIPLDGNSAVQPAQARVEYHWDDSKRKKLRRAYWILEQADHNYGGHKAAAILQIKKAGEIMGMNLHGEGYGGEKQPWSDERLREAHTLLREIVSESGGEEHEHIRRAIKELDKALEVR
jgi:hypothetical protein